MMNVRQILILFILGIGTYAHAQVKQLWTRKIPESVRWHMVTPLGNYVVGTSQGIIGVNPEKGEVIWKNTTFGPVTADKVSQMGSSPLIAVNLGSEVYMLEPYTGEIRFDSKKSGISGIKDQKVLYQSNGILVSGRNSQNKDILLMSSLDDGRIVWKIEDDFGRLVTAQELAPDALLIVTLFYNYKINPKPDRLSGKTMCLK